MRARMSSRGVAPPEATTGRSVAAQTSRSSGRFGPWSMPSLFTSVTTYRAQPSRSSLARTSYRSPPSRVQPRAARVRPRTSRPTATRSPHSAIAAAHHSGCSRAAVPMLTRRQPVAIAAASDSSSRMPPLSSTRTSTRPTIEASSSRLWPRPKAASRSTRWIHSAPASCQRRAASTGSPKRFSDPATPCTSWTAWPSATSTAGSSSRWWDTAPTLPRRAAADGRRLVADDGRQLPHGGGPGAVEDHRARGPDRRHVVVGGRAPHLEHVVRPRAEHRPEPVGFIGVGEAHGEHGLAAERLEPSLDLALGIEPEPVAGRVLRLLGQLVLDPAQGQPSEGQPLGHGLAPLVGLQGG